MTLVGRFRHAMRELRRSPGFVLTTIATLAIGIGLNAAIFSVVDNVLLRPLGYRDADRIVALRSHFVRENRSVNKIGGDDFNDVAREVRSLQAASYYNAYSDGVQLEGAAIFLPIAYVSPSFGEVLGVSAIAGRLFSPQSDAEDEALVSAPFAREHFGSVQAAPGHTLHFEGKPRTIVGVLPNGFSFPENSVIWFKGPRKPDNPNRTAFNQRAIARRRAGVSEAQLSAELATFSGRLQKSFPEDQGKTIEAVPLQEQIVGNVRPTLRLLMAAVGTVLLLVVVNLTHLQLVRSARQMRATTIRSALGASRGVVVARALTESLLLAVAGLVAGLALAAGALPVLLRLAPPDLPRLAEVSLNGDVLLASFGVSVLVMAVTAVLPILRSFRVSPAEVLRQGSAQAGEGRGAVRLRDGFVIAEVAFTLMLSVGAILLARQLLLESRVALGFVPDSFVVLDARAADQDRHGDEEALQHATLAEQKAWIAARQDRALLRLNELVGAVRSTPGVTAAAGVKGAPMGYGTADVLYAVRGKQVFAPGATLPDADVHPVTPEFFATMQAPLLRGRMLTEEDRLGTPAVAVINEALAKQSFPGTDPIGKEISCGLDDPDMKPWRIVGVIADIRHNSPAEPASPAFYVPFAQHPAVAGDMQVVARTAASPAALLETLRRRLQVGFPEVAVKGATMRDAIGVTQQAERFRTLLFSGFAGIGILLAAVGMYGVTAYSVAQRRFEFGLRLALGADRWQMLVLVLGKALVIAGIGVSLGIGLSLGAAGLLNRAVGPLPALDPFSLGIAAALVLLLTCTATLAPATGAAAVEPMQVLRNE